MSRALPWIGGILATLALAGAAIAIFVVSGDDDNGGGNGGTPTADDPNADLPPAASGELRLLGIDPATLDPHLVTDEASSRYIVEIFSGLVTINRDLQIAPDIAESWEISPDGTVYTFHLRDNVTFHGGQRVTAQTVKDSMERAADPRTGSPVADVYLGDIAGVKDRLRGRADEISGIRVVDELTIEITIDAPKPYFLAKLTYPTAFVVDVEQIDANPRNWTRRPNGTGPFELKEWDLGRTIVLEANASFYGGAPSLERATFILAGGSGITMYENDEIDVVGVGLNDIERVRDPGEPLNKEYFEGLNLDISYIGFNVEEPPFNDPKVRRALALAIDKESIAEIVLRDLVVPAKGILPPGMPGYSEDLVGIRFDPEEARKLLAESEFGDDLPRITLTVSGEGANLGPVAEAIIGMWRENLGIEIEVQQVEGITFLTESRRGRYQMWEQGWIADYVDPENFLDIQFHSESVQNLTGYASDELDGVLEAARIEPDVTKRLALYRQAEEIVLRDLPWIPLFHDKDAALVKPYVHGYVPQPLVIPLLAGVTVDR